MADEKKKEKDEGVWSRFHEELELRIKAGIACIWVQTNEEERALKAIKTVCDSLDNLLYVWDLASAMIYLYQEQKNPEKPLQGTSALPVEAIAAFSKKTYRDRSILVLLDYHWSINQPLAIRKLKDALPILRGNAKGVIFVGPRLQMTEETEKDITYLNLDLPGRDELKVYLGYVRESVAANTGKPCNCKDCKGKLVHVTPETESKLVEAALGLTSQEGEDAFSFAGAKHNDFEGNSINLIIDQKCQVLKKEGILEYIKTEESMATVGGCENIKNWCLKRKRAFTPKASAFGLPAPKGIILMGVQGAGKSLLAKAIAAYWQVPLLRYDVGKSYSKWQGETEGSVRKVIETAEIMSPCVLHIDEIEKAFSGIQSSGQTDSGTTARFVQTFLTWLQEKVKPVFVFATCNNIGNLISACPELLRKGRFDEIFFVDLPDRKARSEIIKIHLKKHPLMDEKTGKLAKAREFSQKDIDRIVDVSAGQGGNSYTGAEIEQGIIAGLYEAFEEGERDLVADDVIKALRSFVPLSKTAEATINELRTWVTDGRARPAAGGEETAAKSSEGLKKPLRKMQGTSSEEKVSEEEAKTL
jgi:predicted kinase